jgi:hypothetical protein
MVFRGLNSELSNQLVRSPPADEGATVIQRIAKLIQRSLHPRRKSVKTPTLKDLQIIRSAMTSCMNDCEGIPAQRLHLKIGAAKTAQDLWMLRNDAYQVISQQHSQTEAASRINHLMDAFDGWVEPRQLVKIR